MEIVFTSQAFGKKKNAWQSIRSGLADQISAVMVSGPGLIICRGLFNFKE